ncbi:MAG: hypothetical protein WCJ30_04545, partial [Deltaproteobacteria bacterium]
MNLLIPTPGVRLESAAQAFERSDVASRDGDDPMPSCEQLESSEDEPEETPAARSDAASSQLAFAMIASIVSEAFAPLQPESAPATSALARSGSAPAAVDTASFSSGGNDHQGRAIVGAGAHASAATQTVNATGGRASAVTETVGTRGAATETVRAPGEHASVTTPMVAASRVAAETVKATAVTVGAAPETRAVSSRSENVVANAFEAPRAPASATIGPLKPPGQRPGVTTEIPVASGEPSGVATKTEKSPGGRESAAAQPVPNRRAGAAPDLADVQGRRAAAVNATVVASRERPDAAAQPVNAPSRSASVATESVSSSRDRDRAGIQPGDISSRSSHAAAATVIAPAARVSIATEAGDAPMVRSNVPMEAVATPAVRESSATATVATPAVRESLATATVATPAVRESLATATVATPAVRESSATATVAAPVMRESSAAPTVAAPVVRTSVSTATVAAPVVRASVSTESVDTGVQRTPVATETVKASGAPGHVATQPYEASGGRANVATDGVKATTLDTVAPLQRDTRQRDVVATQDAPRPVVRTSVSTATVAAPVVR